MKRILLVSLLLLIAFSCKKEKINNPLSYKVKKMTYVYEFTPQMNKVLNFEYNNDGLISKMTRVGLNDSVLYDSTTFVWHPDKLIVSFYYSDTTVSNVYNRIIGNGDLKYGNIGFVKSFTTDDGNLYEFYYRKYDNSLQAFGYESISQKPYHYEWSGGNFIKDFQFSGCQTGSNCDENNPNWQYIPFNSTWTEREYYQDKLETRDFGLRFLPIGFDVANVFQLGNKKLLKKMESFSQQNDTTFSNWAYNFSYEFDSFGRVVKESGNGPYDILYEYYN